MAQASQQQTGATSPDKVTRVREDKPINVTIVPGFKAAVDYTIWQKDNTHLCTTSAVLNICRNPNDPESGRIYDTLERPECKSQEQQFRQYFDQKADDFAKQSRQWCPNLESAKK